MNTWIKIAHRLFAGAGVLFAAATLTFVAINVTGGDTAIAILGGPDALPTPQVLARVRAEYHLDRPILEQYGFYLGRLVQGDLGESYRLRIPVKRAIGEQIGATLQLALSAGITALFLSLTIALWTAQANPLLRGVFSQLELVATSIPAFVVGIGLMLIFAFQLRWLPISGSHGWKSLVLPTLTAALPLTALLTQVLRRELEEVLESPFILTARSRGLTDWSVRWGHALRHALIPVVTISGSIFATLLGGAVITETLFSRQGIGRLMVDAAANKDVPLVLGITLLAAFSYVVINLIVDWVYGWIDPRVVAV